MERFALAWTITLCTSLLWPELPSAWLLWLSFAVGVIGVFRRNLLLAGGCFALCWFGWQAQSYQTQLESLADARRNHTIEAKILAVTNTHHPTHLILKLTQIGDIRIKPLLPFIVRVNWYQAEKTIYAGDHFSGEVNLRPAWGSVNQGGFHYSRWLMSRGVVGTGYVKQGSIKSQGSIRGAWHLRLQELIQSLPGSGVIYALLVGDKQKLSAEQRLRWQSAGIGHLLAISGLHLGLVAGWGWLLGRSICLALPKLKILPLSLAISLAFVYGYLTGWPISAQRAMVMLTVGLVSWYFCIGWRPWQSWLLALMVVTLIWPLCIYGTGFWLSFVTMAWLLVLIWIMRTVKFRLLWIQLSLGLVILPMQLGFFGLWPILAVPLNLVMIPLFGWFIVPILMLGSACMLMNESAALALLNLAGHLLSLWDNLLIRLAESIPLSHKVSSSYWPLLLFAAQFALLLCCYWRSFKLWTSLTLLCGGLYFTPSSKQAASWRAHFIDVGQGLAVVVERHGHALIYDTGARYQSGFEFAKAAVLPLLAYRGLNQVDWLVVSHGDNDHAGGLTTLRQAFPLAVTIAGRDQRLTGLPCVGQQIWQGLTLTYWQADLASANGNDSSCVLMISDGNKRLLLTGDIEKSAEQALLKQGLQGPVTVLSAPHHGSRSSSSPAWVDATAPQIVVFSSGAFNRYGFPDEQVVSAYQSAGAQLWNTGRDGQVTIEFSAGVSTRTFRHHFAPYWYNKLLHW